jgi:hypothetical protein
MRGKGAPARQDARRARLMRWPLYRASRGVRKERIIRRAAGTPKLEKRTPGILTAPVGKFLVTQEHTLLQSPEPTPKRHFSLSR